MIDLKSFVFFDLETTGLHNPKITEISLIACSTQHLLTTCKGNLPRVVHKQTLCLNPRRVIHPKASEVTGLYNDLLEYEGSFDKTAGQLIVLFVQRLQAPSCLIAHNGNRFDFSILSKELQKLGISLPESTYCVDSLPLFRHLEKIREAKTNEFTEETNNSIPSEDSKREPEDSSPSQSSADGIFSENDLDDSELAIISELEQSCEALVGKQKLNETTPKRPTKVQAQKNKPASALQTNAAGSVDDKSSPATVSRGQPKSRRQLFPVFTKDGEPKTDAPKRFRLGDVYERLYGQPAKDAHYAEGDVKTLLKCAIAEAKAFISYAEENCVKFSDFLDKR